MNYFPHDTNASSDEKLIVLRNEAGLEAVAIYWAVVEKMYSSEQPLNLEATDVGARSVAMLVGVGFEEFKNAVSTMCELGLFKQIEGTNKVISERIERYIEAMDKKRETARQNGKNAKNKTKTKPKRNQHRTNVGTNVGATSGDILNIKHINKKSVEKHVENQNTVLSSPPKCPQCGSLMTKTGLKQSGTDKFIYRCPHCYEEVCA